MQYKTCTNCSVDLTCGSLDGSCWCMSYTALVEVREGQDCLCEACLKAAIEKEAAAAIESAVQEPDYYIENGLYVFTGSYHLKRGWCCKNGCRHCPYGYTK